MKVFEPEVFRGRVLWELFEAMPRGYRLRVAVFNGVEIRYGQTFTEAMALAYANHVVLFAEREGYEVRADISPDEGDATRRIYQVGGYERW